MTNITLAHWGIIRMNHLKLITLRKAMTVDHLTQICTPKNIGWLEFDRPTVIHTRNLQLNDLQIGRAHV